MTNRELQNVKERPVCLLLSLLGSLYSYKTEYMWGLLYTGSGTVAYDIICVYAYIASFPRDSYDEMLWTPFGSPVPDYQNPRCHGRLVDSLQEVLQPGAYSRTVVTFAQTSRKRRVPRISC